MDLNAAQIKKIRLSFLGIFSVCLSLVSFSQHDTLKDRTEITDFYISAGNSSFPVFTMGQEKFKDIVPKSKLLAGDMLSVNFNDFASDTAGGFTSPLQNTAVYVTGGIILRLKNKDYKKAGPWIKLGVNYFASSTILSTGIFRKQSTTVDSAYFVSSMPVNRVTTDKRTLTYEYACQSLNLEGTLIYKLNPNGIFSLFGGPGAMLGANFGGKATLIASEEKQVTDVLVTPANSSVVYQSNTQKSGSQETFDIHPNLSFGLFVNIGVDLRLGSTFEVIRNTHAFAELKPMFRMYGVKGAGMQSSVLLLFNGGLRYEF